MIENSINSDLANVLGNLVNRTIGMINKYNDGVVVNTSVNEDIDEELIDCVLASKTNVTTKMDEYRIADALNQLFDVYRRCNKYIDETMPWVLAKDETKKDRLNTVLYNLVESIRYATVLLQAFLPDTAKEIFRQLNTEYTTFDTLDSFGKYQSNTKVNDAKVLFQRIENK